jgi:DNA-binding MarR family transcriptional regulator
MKSTKPLEKPVGKKPLLDDFTGDLYVLFSQVHDTINYAQELELRQHGLNFAQGRVMYALFKENKPMTQTEISEWILRKFNTVSNLVDKLEKKGLIKKVKNVKNGKVYIALSNKGIAFWQQVSQRALVMIFSVLSPKEKKAFYEILIKLRTEARGLLGWDFKPPFLP